MNIYDIAVVGAGPAGCMAAIEGARLGKKVILLEKNDRIGRKLLLTGNGRCNLTNTSTLEIFMEAFGRRGSFYRDAFGKFSNHNLMDFFKEHNLELKVEENGRVFPITDKAESVVNVLRKVLEECKVKVVYNYHLEHLNKVGNVFKLSSTDNEVIKSRSVVIATGGVTYGFTGSTGDGLRVAEFMGHHISELLPGEVPLYVREKWVHQLKGVTLEDVGLSIGYGGKMISLPTGNLLLTHFGVSGPVILDASHEIVDIMNKQGDVKLYIDFKPGINHESLGAQLMEDFQNYSKKSLKNYLKIHLPNSTIQPLLMILNIDPQKKLNQISKKERVKLLHILKALPLTITGHLPMDKAMVTCGGVTKKEINPQTMESKLVDGLYFAGEIIAGCGLRGGYNLQQAFSTGYLAGNSAASK